MYILLSFCPSPHRRGPFKLSVRLKGGAGWGWGELGWGGLLSAAAAAAACGLGGRVGAVAWAG